MRQLLHQEFERTWPTFAYILPEARGRDGNMRPLIFPHLTWINSCFAASAALSGVTPLVLQASNTTRFCSSLGFAISPQEYTRNDHMKSEIQNFSGGHAPTPPQPYLDFLCHFSLCHLCHSFQHVLICFLYPGCVFSVGFPEGCNLRCCVIIVAYPDVQIIGLQQYMQFCLVV